MTPLAISGKRRIYDKAASLGLWLCLRVRHENISTGVLLCMSVYMMGVYMMGVYMAGRIFRYSRPIVLKTIYLRRKSNLGAL